MQTTKSANAKCCSGLASLLSPKLFKALSDPMRLSLLVRLAEQREASEQGKEVWCAVQTSFVAKVLRDLADAVEDCCPITLGSPALKVRNR